MDMKTLLRLTLGRLISRPNKKQSEECTYVPIVRFVRTTSAISSSPMMEYGDVGVTFQPKHFPRILNVP